MLKLPTAIDYWSSLEMSDTSYIENLEDEIEMLVSELGDVTTVDPVTVVAEADALKRQLGSAEAADEAAKHHTMVAALDAVITQCEQLRMQNDECSSVIVSLTRSNCSLANEVEHSRQVFVTRSTLVR